MSETNGTDTTNPFEQFLSTGFFSAWTEQSTKRVESLVDEWEKWEKRGAEQAEQAVEETASLMEATLNYSLELQTQFRKQALENSRNMMAMFSGKSKE